MPARANTGRRGGCPRGPTRHTWATRLLRPNGLTRPEYQMIQPMCMTCIMMTSSWRICDVSTPVGMPCQRPVSWHVSIVGPTSHVISREPNWVEQSRVEPSREPRDRIQCSWSYVQPDLRLNLSRSSSQNCFDQILAVWNAIWMISDLFLANLIVPDAMVRSDHWDCDQKWWWCINKKRLPDQEASEGHHGGRWRWWRRRCTCLPNYICWTTK